MDVLQITLAEFDYLLHVIANTPVTISKVSSFWSEAQTLQKHGLVLVNQKRKSVLEIYHVTPTAQGLKLVWDFKFNWLSTLQELEMPPIANS
jgi:hypothetical protein